MGFLRFARTHGEYGNDPEATRRMDGGDGMDRHPILDVRLLGGFEVRVGERLVPAAVWGQRRAAGIVKLLALEPGHRLHREQVVDLLWPELDPESAANNLRVALHHARRGLEHAGAPAGRFLAREGDSLALGPRDGVQVDIEVFARAAARAWQSAAPEAGEEAAALYRGDLLPDDPYEEWAAARRESVRASLVSLLARLSGIYEERGDFSRAVATRERALAVDALDEAANAAIVRLHAAMGQREAALAHYARFAARLQRELGAAPEPETRDLVAAIREGRVATQATAQPPLPAPTLAVAAPVPAAVDVLVGRERELAELGRLLASARLVTLTGPGGIGKTRLALEAARAERGRFADGAAFVDLAAVRDRALVLPTVARALGVDTSGGQPIGELLTTAIGARRVLVVLDNLEQVVSAGADVAALLAACPHLTVLATSRVRLRVRGEQEYPVSPLPLPESARDERGAPLAAPAASPAVALFVLRAQAARPGFALTPEHAETAAAICRRLDGLPLAIELAAARVRLLSLDELLRRLERPLDVLGMASADLPERQRTLRDTIAWSHDLLSPGEQRLFRRLSVFPGGCTLEAAEAVGSRKSEVERTTERPTSDFRLPTSDSVLELLGGLVDQSLVVVRHGGDGRTRYAMLETIREFAAERLAASGEGEHALRALEAFLARLLGEAESGFLGSGQMAWLDRIGEEHDNIRAALGGSLGRGDVDAALALATATAPFWRARGFAGEGVGWLERTVALAEDAPVEMRAAALDALGGLATDLGEFSLADRVYQESVELWVSLGDRHAMVQGLFALAVARSNSGAVVEARAALEDALAMAGELDDERGVAAALHNLGMLAREAGELDRAISLLDESMTTWRRLGDAHWIGVTASNLGDAYRLAGESKRARTCFDESADRYRELGDRFGLGVVANQRGMLEQSAGRPGAAMQRHAEALRHFDAVRAPLGMIESIEWLAVAAAETHGEDALRLFAATASARDARGLSPLAADAEPVALGLERARRGVGPGAEAALTAGAALALDEARRVALAMADDVQRA